MKIAALMLSGLSSYDRARVCVETWLQDFDYFQIHSFTPCAGLPNLWLTGEREGPRSCFKKRLNGLDAALHTEMDADWYLCCSDDNYVWRENLEAALQVYENVQYPLIVGGHAFDLRIADGTRVHYPSGGGGYVLNQRALEDLVANLEHLLKRWAVASNNDDIEDVFMGWACKMLKIPFVEVPQFFGCNPMDGSCHTLDQVMKPITFHYVKAEQMMDLRRAHLVEKT